MRVIVLGVAAEVAVVPPRQSKKRIYQHTANEKTCHHIFSNIIRMGESAK